MFFYFFRSIQQISKDEFYQLFLKYHIIEEVDDPVERFTDARDLLESLGACVMFLNLIDDKAGRHDGVASENTESNQDADQTAHP